MEQNIGVIVLLVGVVVVAPFVVQLIRELTQTDTE